MRVRVKRKRNKLSKMTQSLASKAFFGMVGLFMMPGLAVLLIRYNSTWCSKKEKEGKKKKEPISCLYFELQVAQVLLTLPYSFSQLGMLSGIILQIFYGIMGSWTAYLISVLYVEYRSRKEKENVSFKNHVIQVSFSRTNPQNKN